MHDNIKRKFSIGLLLFSGMKPGVFELIIIK